MYVCCAWKKEKHYCYCINSLKYSKINITYYLLTYVFNYEIIWNPADNKIFTFFYILAAWVHRGFTDDVTEITKIEPCGDLLTDFQKDKYRYFFLHVLDLNSDYVISAEDFVKLNEVSCLMRLIVFSRHCLSTLFQQPLGWSNSLYTETKLIFKLELKLWKIVKYVM